MQPQLAEPEQQPRPVPDCDRCNAVRQGTNHVKFMYSDGFYCDGCHDYLDAMADAQADLDLERIMLEEGEGQ